MSDVNQADGPPKGVATMSVVRWVLVALTALVAVGSIVSYSRGHFGGHAAGAGGGAAGGAAGGKKEPARQLYQCPMHPQIIRDRPGECPICGMTLVPMREAKPAPSGSAGAPGVPGLAAVDLTPERIQLIGMRTAAVNSEPLGDELHTVGVIGPNERGLAQITTRFAGWLQKLAVSATGERVRRGQVLATIYSPDVLRAQQELLVARGWTSGAGGEPRSAHGGDSVSAGMDANARRRLELLGVSAQEIDEIVRTGKAMDAIPIRSPVEGYVVAKNAVVGVSVQPGTVLFQIADLSSVWVNAEIYEHDIARIHVGQKARLELTAFPGETYTGKVQFIYPVLDPTSRTLRLRLEFRNRNDRNGPRLKPGMYGTVLLDLPSKTGLMVPAEAVVDTGEAQYLFVAKPGGHFEPRLVKVGTRVKDRIEVLSGVADGETVVTTGNFLIDSESRLRAAVEGRTASTR